MVKKSGSPAFVCFGEVLWDILPQGRKIGGAPLNVAYHLSKLGVHAILVSRVGKDDYGNDIKAFVQKNGLCQSLIQTDNVHPSGIVKVSLQPEQEITYDIVKNAAWDFIEYNNDVDDLMKDARYLVYGSLITRNKVSRNTLFRLLEKPLIKILDVNLRKPFYTKDILQKLIMKADIIKMNRAELHLISGWFGLSSSNEEMMQALSTVSRTGVIIVTDGSKGAYLLHGREIIFDRGEKVKVVDTVGSGDAFLAGFLSKYIAGGSWQASLRQANAMGALVAQKTGGCPVYDLPVI